VFGDPFFPFRPPGTLVLACAFKPFVRVFVVAAVASVAILFSLGRIDDSADMARSGKRKFYRPGQQTGGRIGGLSRNNMILAGGEDEAGRLDPTEINGHATKGDFPWPH
jgi:hypothetical protein